MENILLIEVQFKTFLLSFFQTKSTVKSVEGTFGLLLLGNRLV